MPTRTFAITADDKPVVLDAKGVGEIAVTVANTASKPIRGLARIAPLGTTDGGWLKILGETERSFSAGETHQVVVCMTAPPHTAAGKYPFRLNMMSVQNPDDDFAEGPALAFELKAGPVPITPPKTRNWLFLIILAVVLIGGGAIIYHFISKSFPMPGLGGMTLTEVTNKLNEAALTLAEVISVPVGTNKPGTVVSQTPDPGTPVKKGDAVTVSILLFPKSFPMLRLVGMTLTQVTNRMNEKALTLAEVIPVPAGTNKPGTVVSQTPDPGTLVKRGDAVTVKIASALGRLPPLRTPFQPQIK